MSEQLDAVTSQSGEQGTKRQNLIEHLLDQQDDSWFSYWLVYLKQQVLFSEALLLADEKDLCEPKPVAVWPSSPGCIEELLEAAEEAKQRQRSLLTPLDDQRFIAACPLMNESTVMAVIALVLPVESKEKMSSVLSTVMFCSGWLELRLRRSLNQQQSNRIARQQRVFDGLTAINEQRQFQSAALAYCNMLRRQFNCERVLLAYIEGERVKIACQSDSNEYVERLGAMDLCRKAMVEAHEQLETISWPVRSDRQQVTLAHQRLAEFIGQMSVMTVPLIDREYCYGMVLFERTVDRSFTDTDRLTAEPLCNFLASILEHQRQAQLPLWKLLGQIFRNQLSRFLKPGYLGRKLTAITGLLLVVFFSLVKADYRLSSDAVLEGAELRAVVVPFDGYLEQASVKAGDKIDKGEAIASLDNRELRLQRLKWLSEQAQAARQYEDALARQDRSQVQVFRAQKERAGSELSLVEFQLAQASMTAPFDAIVVSGDQSQQIGSAVRQGDTLFELAPDDRYRLTLFVDEFRIQDIKQGQQGELLLAAMPDQSFPFNIQRMTYMAEAREGATVYRVEAELEEGLEQLRPGLEGVAKVNIDRRFLISIWTRSMSDWLKLQWWRLWG